MAGSLPSIVLESRLEPTARGPIAVAYSGGADSLVALVAARDWARGAGREVVALHVDHGLNPTSGAWADLAEANSRALGVGFRSLRWEGPKPANGLPAAARRARLSLLAEAAREAGAGVIVFGHTGSDIAEGAAMRAEGSTLGDLREWSPSPVWPEGRGLFHLRPLLALSRAETRRRALATGLPFIDDPANADPAYARSRARRALDGEAVAGPAHPREGLADRARAAREDGFGGFSIARVELERPGGRALLRLLLACASGREGRVRSAALDRLAARLAAPGEFTATLGGASVMAGAEDVLIRHDAGELKRRGIGPLACPAGATVVWDGRFEVRSNAVDLVVHPVDHVVDRLEPAAREALRAAPARIRGALPAVTGPDGTAICPVVTPTSLASARALQGARLAGAAGLIAGEVDMLKQDRGGAGQGALSCQ